MCRRTSIVFSCISLLLLLVGDVSPTEQSYRNFVRENHFDERLRLLEPKRLFENYNSSADRLNATAINYTCGRDIAVVQQAILRQEIWALKMLDASSKIPEGLLEGNIVDIGMYDECISARGESLNVKIRGKHCMYSISLSGNASLPLNPTLSICVPASCSANDLAQIFNNTINAIEKFKNLGITVASANCATLDLEVWDTEFIVCFCIFAVFLGFLIICSALDIVNGKMYAGQLRHPAIRILSQFSLQKNAAAILNTEPREGNLPVIHGIRVLSIAWVVLGHEYVIQIFGVNVNNLALPEWVKSWNSLYIFIAPFAVDTFFAVSGFLMTYLFLKQMPKQKRFNVPMYYIHRYIRLTPPVIALLVISIVFLPKAGSGARWEMVMNLFVGSCRSKWWPNLLYVQNFVDRDNMCLGHLWYLAVDMQLFWVSPIILYPLYKKPKIGLIIFALMFIASLAIPSTIVGVNKYPEFSFTSDSNITLAMDIFENVYEVPYNRAAAWLVGILFGFEVINKTLRLNKIHMLLGWVLTFASLAFCIFGTRSFMVPTYVYNPIWETLFAAISRPIWAFAVCWIIYASVNDYGGPIATFLSWKFFLPLSRISYCLYLVHIVIQILQVSALRVSGYFSDYYVWRNYLSDLGISIVIAFLFTLLFESPILILEKLTFRRKQETRYESEQCLTRAAEEEEA